MLSRPAQSLFMMLRLRRSILPTARAQCRHLTISPTRRNEEEPFEGFFQQLQEAYDEADSARRKKARRTAKATGTSRPEAAGRSRPEADESKAQKARPEPLAAKRKEFSAAAGEQVAEEPKGWRRKRWRPEAAEQECQALQDRNECQALQDRYEAQKARPKPLAAKRKEFSAAAGEQVTEEPKGWRRKRWRPEASEQECQALQDRYAALETRSKLYAEAYERWKAEKSRPEVVAARESGRPWEGGHDTTEAGEHSNPEALDNLSKLGDYGDYIRNARARIEARKPRVMMDYLSPTNSHLLNLALMPHVPPDFRHRDGPRGSPGMLADGHHMVYFPPFLAATDLLPDGTDPAHSPGEPFVRRMWAGGSLQWARHEVDPFVLDGRPAWCHETVGPPVLKRGRSIGDEKVFVEVKRMYFFCKDWPRLDKHALSKVSKRLCNTDHDQLASMTHADDSLACPLVETRTLVFVLKDYVGKKADASGSGATNLVEPRFDVCFEATPDARLLFHFSALSHNAHAIHLDPTYARGQEGHRGLLVHGPLTAVLMLSAVRHHRRFRPASLDQFNYTNLAPLYAGEKLRVCVRETSTNRGVPDGLQVCIQGPDGRLAVNARAKFKYVTT